MKKEEMYLDIIIDLIVKCVKLQHNYNDLKYQSYTQNAFDEEKKVIDFNTVLATESWPVLPENYDELCYDLEKHVDKKDVKYEDVKKLLDFIDIQNRCIVR